MRFSSGVSPSAAWVGTERSMLVARGAGLVTQWIGHQTFRQRLSQACVGGVDQDGAHVDAPVGDDAAVVAEKLALIVPGHHFRRDPLLWGIAVPARGLGADAKR